MRVLNRHCCHLVGWAEEAREGRVSSPVVHWEARALQAVTESGRRYALVGPPGFDPDATYVWTRWLRLNGSPSWKDETAAVLAMATSRNGGNDSAKEADSE